MAAITGLMSTSESPPETEKTTVPSASPRYTFCGKMTGASAYMSSPRKVITGVNLTVAGILNL